MLDELHNEWASTRKRRECFDKTEGTIAVGCKAIAVTSLPISHNKWIGTPFLTIRDTYQLAAS